MSLINEVFLGPGDWSIPFFRDKGIEEIIKANVHKHMLFFWGERGIFTGVILKHQTTEHHFIVSGRNCQWWLGVENDGHPNDFRRYFSRRNMLDNGNFELGELYWRRNAENSKWKISQEYPIKGEWGARTNQDFDDDDVMQHEGSWDVYNGDRFWAKALVTHDSSYDEDGSVRLRLVYSGRFKHKQLNSDPGFDTGDKWELGDAKDIDIVNDPKNAYSGSKVLKLGPIEKEQFLENRGFEDGFEFWEHFNSVEVSDEHPHLGSLSAKFFEGGLDTPALHQKLTGAKDGNSFACGFRLNAYKDPDTEMVFRVRYKTNEGDWEVLEPVSRAHFQGNYNYYNGDFTLSDMDEDVTPTVIIASDEIIAEGAAWFVDEIACKRIEGNVQGIGFKNRTKGDYIAVIPKATYRVTAKVRSDQSVRNGEVWFRIKSKRAAGNRKIQFIDSPTVAVTDNEWTKFEWEFNTESGYDRASLRIMAQDIYGGSFWIDQVEMKLADENELIVEDVVTTEKAQNKVAALDIRHTPPNAAESVRYEFLVENDGAGWRVDHCSLILVRTPSRATAIVEDLLDGTGINPGNLYGAGAIDFDWVVRNRTSIQMLEELSFSGLINPQREWFMGNDFKLDWGKPSQIYTDRTNLIFTKHNMVLKTTPDGTFDAEPFVQRVKVVGAERESFRGKTFIVSGLARNDPVDKVLPDDTAFVRRRYVEDPSVDHVDYATGLARDVANISRKNFRSFTMSLNDWKVWGNFFVGDWVYVYYPEEGIINENNEVEWEGGVVYPEKLRVISRRFTMGSGPFKVKLRTGRDEGGGMYPGTVIELPSDAIDWPAITSAEVEVGDPRPGFVGNPQGGSTGIQYMRYRKRVKEI